MFWPVRVFFPAFEHRTDSRMLRRGAACLGRARGTLLLKLRPADFSFKIHFLTGSVGVHKASALPGRIGGRNNASAHSWSKLRTWKASRSLPAGQGKTYIISWAMGMGARSCWVGVVWKGRVWLTTPNYSYRSPHNTCLDRV